MSSAEAKAAEAWIAKKSTGGFLLHIAARAGVDDQLLRAAKRRLVLYAAAYAKGVLRYLPKRERRGRAAVEAAEAFGRWDESSRRSWPDVIADADKARDEAGWLVDELSEHTHHTRRAWAAVSAMIAARSVRGGLTTSSSLAHTADDAQFAAEAAEAALRDMSGAQPPWLDWVVEEVAAIVKRVIPWPRPWKVGSVIGHGDGWVLWHAYRDDLEPTAPPLFSVQITPRFPDFTGWQERVQLYDALDFIGWLGPDAMTAACQAVGIEPFRKVRA